MFFAVFVHFIKQFFCISLRLFRNCLFSLLFEIRTCFYVGSVHKNCFCIQISFLCRCFQHPAEYILYCRVVKPVLKVITHCGKMWHCFIQRIPYEPSVCQIHIHFFQGSTKRRNSIDMLNQHNLEQNHRINAWSAVVLTVQLLYKLVDLLKVNCRVDLSQQVLLRDHVLQTYKFKLPSIFCILHQHFYHPTPLYRIFVPDTRKRPLFGDLFRQADAPSL